jgi:hypothetical protein
MGDARRYWRESIGVVRAPARPRSAESETTEAVEELTAPQQDDAQRLAKTARSASSPGSRREQIGRSEPDAGRDADPGSGGVEAMRRVLGSLPVGSFSFADEVARKLWPRPQAEDLRRLALIAGERHRVRDVERRDDAVTAVAMRYRVEKLTRLLGRPVVDATVLQARAVEWARLAQMTDQQRRRLAEEGEEPSGRAVLDAARDLLGDPGLLEAEALLAGELANLLDRFVTGEFGDVVAIAQRVADLEPLVAAVRGRQLRRWDGLFLEVLAAGCVLRRAIEHRDEKLLRRLRIAVTRLEGRFEAAVEVVTHEHAHDRDTKTRMALWRRFLRGVRQRMDDALTAPDLPPAEPTPSPQDPADSDAGALARLREARASLQPPQPERSGTDRAAPRRPRWRWWPFVSTVVLLAALAGAAATVLLPPSIPGRPSATPADFARQVPLVRVDSAGVLLVATADPGWSELETDERRLAATRLMSRAEAIGFRGGLLVAPDGRPLASWSPGREPTLRRPLDPPQAVARRRP